MNIYTRVFSRGTIFLILVLSLSACASSTLTAVPTPTSRAAISEPTQIPTSKPVEPSPTAAPTVAPSPTPLPVPTENPIHALGQLVQLPGLSLALITVDFTPAQIQVTFAAKNTTTAVASINFIDFSAVGSDGVILKSDACFTTNGKTPDYAVPSFGGVLEPGENLRGTICWKSADPKGNAPAPQTGIKVSYTPEGSAKSAGLWDVSAPGNVDAPASLAASELVSPPHAQGDQVMLKDLSITFTGVTFQGVGQDKTRVVMAHYTFENKGSDSYQFGNFLSYSFSVKLADGSPLGTDFMTVGCQNTAANVKILPSQKQSVTICFVDPGVSALAPGSLAIFSPNPGEGDKIFWVTQ